jgi:hypothetical protein
MMVLVLLAAYPLSWGPYVWLLSTERFPDALSWADHVYDPLRDVYHALPEPAQDAWKEYLQWWVAR